MKNGLILGKFMPLHTGHEYLIKEGLRNCDRLHVVVCSLTNEPIDGELRFTWVKNRFASEIEQGKMVVHHLEEDWIPQEPSECNSTHAFYGCWAGVMEGLCGQVDIMFASEKYIYPMSAYLGCESYLVDYKRETFPVSGTKIRENPFKHWYFMNEEVRKYYTKKILIIGGESTGKSTLTQMLQDHYLDRYNAIGIQEYARGWIDNVLGGDMGLLEYDDITMFGEEQMRLVESCLGHYQVVFSDTDAIVSAVFQDVYYNRVSPDLEDVIDKEKWDLVLFCLPDVPWVDDGQRNLSDDKVRMGITARLGRYLGEHDMFPVQYISGDFEKRFETAKFAVDNLLLQV